MKKWILFGIVLSFFSGFGYLVLGNYEMSSGYLNKKEIGQIVDSLNGVYVYYNGSIGNVSGRNLTPDGYNLGLKYQCVEFVKRYYYEHLNHKMPNSYGHAKDFFNSSIKDGNLNPGRNLIQYQNPGMAKPEINDILVFKGTVLNPYGHVAIISAVHDNKIGIIQQNAGILLSSSRDTLELKFEKNKWTIKNNHIMGWLRKK
jgi:surface antigen